MIIEKVKVKITAKIKNNLLLDGICLDVGNISEIDAKYLTNSSTIVVKAKCHFCDIIKELKYQTYLGNIKSNGLFACSHKCSITKYKMTCFNRFGFDNASKSTIIKEKIKSIFNEKYGYDSSLCSPEIIIKTKKTMMDKYRVENASKSPVIMSKIVETNIKKYGFKTPSENQDIKDKTKISVNEKYGFDSSLCSPEVIIKTKKTMMDKYGTLNFNSSEIGKKLNSDRLFEKLSKDINNDKYKILKIEDYSIDIIHSTCDSVFSISKRLLSERRRNNNEICLLCNKLESFSDNENKIYEFVKSLNINCEKNNRSVLSNNREIDIYCHDNKIGIEHNELYWHSSLFKDRNYHFNKYNDCLSNGIKLIQIWEDDWIHKNEIVKSILLNKFNLITNKIGSRRCSIRITSYKDSLDFLTKNHIQGNCPSTHRIGLYYCGELVSLMTLGKRSINGTKSMELLRFCNKLNLNVIGSASRIFRYFLNNIKTDEYNIIKTYSDNCLFDGNVYNKIGFTYIGYTSINYYWCDKKNITKYHRQSFSKKNLVKSGFDKNKTEDSIMEERGYIKVWGAGQKLWRYE